MSKKRKRYTDEFRANAVLMLEAAGYTGEGETSRDGALMAVSNRLGVPHSTLRRWFIGQQNPPPSKLVHKKKYDLLGELQQLLKLTVTHATKEITGNADDVDFRTAVTSAAILIDKIQLLQGKPTLVLEIKEMLQLGTVTPEQVREELGDELAQELFSEMGLDFGRNS